MRTREWYGWHFPELTKIIGDNLAYAKSVKKMGKLKLRRSGSACCYIYPFYIKIYDEQSHIIASNQVTEQMQSIQTSQTSYRRT